MVACGPNGHIVGRYSTLCRCSASIKSATHPCRRPEATAGLISSAGASCCVPKCRPGGTAIPFEIVVVHLKRHKQSTPDRNTADSSTRQSDGRMKQPKRQHHTQSDAGRPWRQQGGSFSKSTRRTSRWQLTDESRSAASVVSPAAPQRKVSVSPNQSAFMNHVLWQPAGLLL